MASDSMADMFQQLMARMDRMEATQAGVVTSIQKSHRGRPSVWESPRNAASSSNRNALQVSSAAAATTPAYPSYSEVDADDLFVPPTNAWDAKKMDELDAIHRDLLIRAALKENEATVSHLLHIKQKQDARGIAWYRKALRLTVEGAYMPEEERLALQKDVTKAPQRKAAPAAKAAPARGRGKSKKPAKGRATSKSSDF